MVHVFKFGSFEEFTILEPCLDRGSIEINCLNINRKYVGYDIFMEYFGTARQRLETKKIVFYN
jgi:DNA modification methylase